MPQGNQDSTVTLHNRAWYAASRWILALRDEIDQGLYSHIDLSYDVNGRGLTMEHQYLVAYTASFVEGWYGYERGEELSQRGEFLQVPEDPDCNTAGYQAGWGERALRG